MVGFNLLKNWNLIIFYYFKWFVILILLFYLLVKFLFVFSFNRIDILSYENYEKLYFKLICVVEEICGFVVEWLGVWFWKWFLFDFECDF